MADNQYSFDSLKDYPRVPKTDGSGIQIGVGGIPPNKKAISYGRPVDMAEAVSNYNKRARGEMPRIPGGIDDNDQALYDKPESASPFRKMHVAQHHAMTSDQVEALKRKETDEPAVETGGPAGADDASARVATPEDSTNASSPTVVLEPVVSVRTFPVNPIDERESMDVPPQVSSEKATRKRRPEPRQQIVERIIEKPVYVEKEVPVFKEVEKIVEKPADGPFEKWSKNRVRVQIGTTETTFSMSAVAAIRSPNGITVILPTANDAMTFVPRTGAHVTLGISNEMTRTIFTGVSFEIEELGIMGLCFLVDRKQQSEES